MLSLSAYVMVAWFTFHNIRKQVNIILHAHSSNSANSVRVYTWSLTYTSCKTTTSFLFSAVIFRLQKMAQLRNAHLCQKPCPHPVQPPIKMAPLQLLQVLLVFAHTHFHTPTQSFIIYIIFIYMFSAPGGVMNTIRDTISTLPWLVHSVANVTRPLQHEQNSLQ